MKEKNNEAATVLTDERIDAVAEKIGGKHSTLYLASEGAIFDFARAIEAEVLAQAGVSAEPVAWMRKNGQECRTTAEKKHMESLDSGLWKEIAASYTIPLYTAPTIPAQVPAAEVRAQALSDAEIIEATSEIYLSDFGGKGTQAYDIAVARAVLSASAKLSQSSTVDKASEVRAAEWISVEDRLPEEGATVLTTGPNYGAEGRGYWFQSAKHKSGWFDFSDAEDEEHYQPTHWMPLPAAPSTADSGNTDEKGGDK